MSSRSNKVYTTSETAPNGAALGDEWHVPSTGGGGGGGNTGAAGGTGGSGIVIIRYRYQ